MNDDPVFINDFIHTFERSARETVSLLKHAAKDDWKNFSLAAHRLKGSASAVGALILIELADRAQNFSPEEYGQSADLIISRIEAETKLAIAALNNYLEVFDSQTMPH